MDRLVTVLTQLVEAIHAHRKAVTKLRHSVDLLRVGGGLDHLLHPIDGSAQAVEGRAASAKMGDGHASIDDPAVRQTLLDDRLKHNPANAGHNAVGRASVEVDDRGLRGTQNHGLGALLSGYVGQNQASQDYAALYGKARNNLNWPEPSKPARDEAAA